MLLICIALAVTLGTCHNKNRDGADDGVSTDTPSETPTGTTGDDEYTAEAKRIYALLLEGEYEQVLLTATEEVRAQVTAELLAGAWEKESAAQGGYISIADAASTQQGGFTVVQVLGQHERGQIMLTCSFDGDMLLGGLYIAGIPSAGAGTADGADLPDGATEYSSPLFAGTTQELAANIVLPAGGAEGAPAVVLVHGSGPSDMDETIGPNKPFRDIAYGLAAQGIASIRFDKITYSYPDMFSNSTITIDDEYTQAVQEAYRVLAAETAAEQIFIIGHSQGGMITPYLMEVCGFDGGVIMAGTPRKLWELSFDQNSAYVQGAGDGAADELGRRLLEEREKALDIMTMSDEELKETMIFGLSGYYLKSMEELDEVAIAISLGRPLLIMQGEDDFQVSYETDFFAWVEQLAPIDALVTYCNYPGLDHLFMPASGDITDAAAAYSVAQNVEPGVITDIADWIHQHS